MKKIICLMSSFLFLAPSVMADSSWSSESTDTLKSQGCSPQVAKSISDAQSNYVNGRTKLAQTLLDKAIGSASYRMASCLDNLLPNLQVSNYGLDAGNITSALTNAACNYVEQMTSSPIGDINNALSSGESYLTNSLTIPSVGGINLGTVANFQNTNINSTQILSNLYQQNVSGWDDTKSASQLIYKAKDVLGLDMTTSSTSSYGL